MDVVYVEDQAFLNALNQSAKYKTLACMGTTRKLSSEELLSGMNQVIHHYKKQGIGIEYLHLDNRFKSIK